MTEKFIAKEIIIDATNAPLGRLASIVAKKLLKGEKIIIINAERAIITGNPGAAKEKYHERRSRGSPQHGPFFPTKADAIMRRTVRGMLPYKKPKGRNAFMNLRVQVGSEGIQGSIDNSVLPGREIKTRYITLKDLSIQLRGEK